MLYPTPMSGFSASIVRSLSFFATLCICTQASGQSGPMELIKNVLAPTSKTEDTLTVKETEKPVSLGQLRNFQTEIVRVKNTLRRRPDTTEVADFIPRVEALVAGIETTLNDREIALNLRMIGSILNFINFSERSLTKYESELGDRLNVLAKAKQSMDSIEHRLSKPKLLSDQPYQSKEFNEFLTQIASTFDATAEELKLQQIEILRFDSKVQNIRLDLQELAAQLQFESRRIADNIFSKEIPYLWHPLAARDSKHLERVLNSAIAYNSIILFRYLRVYMAETIAFIILLVVLIFWFQKTYDRILRDNKNKDIILSRTTYIPNFPKYSAALALLSLFVLFYPDPPMVIFSIGIFLVGTITGILLRKRVQKPVFITWCVFYVLFIFSILSNLFWEIVFEERHLIMFFSISGIVVGLIYILRLKAYTKELPKYFVYISWAYVAIEFCSLVFNTLGRLSLSKMLSITATVGLMQAISLIIFVMIVKEFIYLQIELRNQKNSDPTSSNDYVKLKIKTLKVFSLLAVGLWLYFFLKNLSLLELVIEEVSLFLEKPRSLLYAKFSFGTIFTFFLTLYFATFLANNLAYFSEIRDRKFHHNRNKRFGSQVLLLRLAIIALGFFIALAAAGIPIDRITIVLGALSVGIGFGLQTIINNLVSGVILAFERPIQIGDTIDSGPDQGVVKEIGIRASKIKNWDGAEVIIPNGNLLANRLTNWTLSDKKRRVELTIGVAYNSEIDLVTELIQNALVSDGILKFPSPLVLFQNMNESSLDFRVLFWVSDFEIWIAVRDQAMRAIYHSLKENGIEIPFPQRDLHIKSFQREAIQPLADLDEIKESKTNNTESSKE